MQLIEGLYLPDGDEHFKDQLKVGPMFWGYPTYQFKKFATIFPHIKNFRHAVDIGAHCGLWSRVLEKVFPKVSAFEPIPEHLECLHANTKTTRIYPVALGNTTGTARMSRATSNSGNASICPNGAIEVPITTLDRYGFEEVDFIKIDCEGYEHNVLLGSMETIKANRPAIIVERHQSFAKAHNLPGKVKLLEGLGMKVIAKLNNDYLLTF